MTSAKSAALEWIPFLRRLKPAAVYAADPGAVAVFEELVPCLKEAGRFRGMFVDGWATGKIFGAEPASELLASLHRHEGLILGSQTTFARTRKFLAQAAANGVETTFVFDHWKNFAEHFGDGPLPTHIVVPDEIAQAMLVKALKPRCTTSIVVLPHLAVAAAAERIMARPETSCRGLIAMLLDPTEASDGLGYDWRSALKMALAAATAAGVREVQVKPHPRQDPRTVADFLSSCSGPKIATSVYTGDLETLVARAEEVWGMTTIALNIAIAAGKTVRSFQPNRTLAGVQASNPHLEKLVQI